MVDSNLSLSQRYEQFVAANPLYKSMPASTVGSIMLSQNLITKQELNELTQSLFTKKEKTFDLANLSGYESMGLRLSTNKNKSSAPKNYVEKLTITHPRLSFLELKQNGDVDLSQFSLSCLRSKYNNKNYNITEENGTIKVTKKDGSLVFSVTNNPHIKNMKFIKLINGKNETTLQIISGKLDSYTIKGEKQGVEISTEYSGDKNLPLSRRETYKNGDRKTITYDKVTGKKEFEDYWKKDGCTPEWFVKYSNGKPYKKANGYKDKNPEYVLVNDLKDDIYAKTKLGLPTTRKSISENVLKRITAENVVETIIQYEKLTGNDLINDIENEIGLSSNLKKQLTSHIEKLYISKATPAEAGKFIASRLYYDMKGVGSGNIEKHIELINNENLQFVLQAYIFNHMGDDVREKRKGLLTEINDEVGLGNKRQQIISKLVDIATEKLNKSVKKDILNDVASHSNDPYLIEKDLMRAIEISQGGDLRNPNNQTEITKPNGKFDAPIKQGRMGDCWLVSGTISLIQKEHGRKLLEDAIKIDKNTGDAIVTLKGYGKTYRISAELIQDSNYLASGEGDMRVIELAIDKYIKEQAAKRGVPNTYDSYDNININGGHSRILYEALGAGTIDCFKDGVATYDFNDEKSYYNFALPEFGGYTTLYDVATDSNGQKVDIYTDHEYTIVGSDKDNIYFINPWDSENKLSVSRNVFEENYIWVDSYTFKA